MTVWNTNSQNDSCRNIHNRKHWHKMQELYRQAVNVQCSATGIWRAVSRTLYNRLFLSSRVTASPSMNPILPALWRSGSNVLPHAYFCPHSGNLKWIWTKDRRKIWNRVDWKRSEKKIQNTQEIKRTLFNKTEQDKRANFRCNHLFQATYNTTENSLTNLSLSVLLFSSRQSRALFLPPASWHLTDEDKLV